MQSRHKLLWLLSYYYNITHDDKKTRKTQEPYSPEHYNNIMNFHRNE